MKEKEEAKERLPSLNNTLQEIESSPEPRRLTLLRLACGVCPRHLSTGVTVAVFSLVRVL